MRKIFFTICITYLSFAQQTFADEDSVQLQNANNYNLAAADARSLNHKLLEQDSIYFSHNGIVLPGETITMYLSRIQNETERVAMLHALEKNTVRLGMLFLGNPDKSMTVLDAGCGAGGCSIMIHDVFGCPVEGITLSSDQAIFGNLIAQSYGFQDSISFSQGDMLNLNKDDQSYDCIWACESTEQVQDLNALFTELGRVAKPAARMVIIAWCASDPDVKSQVDDYYSSNIHTFQDYMSAAESAGWTSFHQWDLTGQTAMYWNIRSSSHIATDAEQFIGPKFASRDLQYYLLTFEKIRQTYYSISRECGQFA